MEGTPFGRYRLVELLGRGGMGEVWKAFDTATRRVVAVKVLPPQLASDPKFEQRFRREAFAAAGLNNPHVVPIHNFGEIDGRLYVDMRLIEGQDLEHVLADGPLDADRAVKVIEQVASALNAAHRIGLVHRDVKPSNILVAEDDFAYLIDFGIARGAGETNLTATGNVVGTWPYMAPERFSTGQSDTRSDIYALTCVLYECLTSSRPFPGDSVEQQIAGHLTAPPPRPSISRPGVSSGLDDVIATGMAKDPNARYGTTIELARAAKTAVTTVIPRPPGSPHTAAGVGPSAPTQARTPDDGHGGWAPTQAAQYVDETLPPTQIRPAAPVGQAIPLTQAGAPEHVKAAWAPTHMGTPEHVEKAWSPIHAHPAGAPPEPPPPARRPPEEVPGHEAPRPEAGRLPWWRRAAIVIPLAVVLMLGALATIFVVLSGGGAETTTQPSKPTGPLDGTFTVAFGPPTRPNGQPYDNAPGGDETWAIKSACRDGKCVATASRVSGSQSAAQPLVLDQIDGRWKSVTATQGTCENKPTEMWESMSLQPQPDGSLQGEFIVRSTSACARNQQVTFTRTGDVENDASLVDPATQPPRVASPAEALRGRYQETDTYASDGGRSAEVGFDIQTYCLRTGDRCLSYWLNPDDVKILLFSQNQWVLSNTSTDSTCKNGSPAHREISLQYPLPQPAQDPITLLTGRGHYTVTGGCPYDSDFDSRVERTGD